MFPFRVFRVLISYYEHPLISERLGYSLNSKCPGYSGKRERVGLLSETSRLRSDPIHMEVV